MSDSWERAEVEWFAAEQARVDRVRVHGYTLACCIRVEKARAELDRRLTLLERAQEEAEQALENLRHELDCAESMTEVVALDDPELNEELARALEQLEDESLEEVA